MKQQQRALLLLLALPLLGAAGEKKKEAASDPRWLRCVVATYRMVQETGTRSHETQGKRATRSFLGSLGWSHRNSPRVLRKDFIDLARVHKLELMTKSDRRTLDRNLVSHLELGNLRTALHLHQQWGVEGKCLARSPEQDIQHVETCRICRDVYGQITRETTLGCGSTEIGYQEPVFNDDPDKRMTIPP